MIRFKFLLRTSLIRLTEVLFADLQGSFDLHLQCTEVAFRGVLRKRCSENIHQIYRRTPMPKSDLDKVAKQLY